MDPTLICKKTRRLRGRLADICKKEPALLKEISKGVSLGTKECQYQFRNRRWNCTTVHRSLRKILMRVDGGEGSALHPDHFTSRDRVPVTLYRSLEGPQTSISTLRPTHTPKELREGSLSPGIKLPVLVWSDTRETGFVNAITAAGVTFAVTRACTMGDLIECSCEKSTKGTTCWIHGTHKTYCITFSVSHMYELLEVSFRRHSVLSAARFMTAPHKHLDLCSSGFLRGCAQSAPRMWYVAGRSRLSPFSDHSAATGTAAASAVDGDWVWGGCGDNVNFGYRKSKDFMDAPYRRRSDIKTLVKLHNNNAGRLAVKNFMRTDCKCHGLSGSCAMRTCWRKMPPFRDVGNRLKERFDGAAKVIPSNDGRSFIPEGDTIKPPDRGDLVYSEDSPDFCKPNRKTGSLGTQGRQCNATSPGVEGCELLCCGRGYDTRQVRQKTNCRCRFKWCCEVTCDTCSFKTAINTCR
ncbi:hypothetical protein B7P43_G01971 [Cryptotermes secundus]|uniref:Protein Wnt n=1 Tax=Cryptotermes secundus TaxID=105785 RepID=A0A2J7RGA2_9NEOP|nr:hypothetical protein B7P43_G01971 [Cryptotermes secundus]